MGVSGEKAVALLLCWRGVEEDEEHSVVFVVGERRRGRRLAQARIHLEYGGGPEHPQTNSAAGMSSLNPCLGKLCIPTLPAANHRPLRPQRY